MNTMKEQLGLKGHIKVTLNKGTEKEKVVHDKHNTISTDIRVAAILALYTGGWAGYLNASELFDGHTTPPPVDQTGIIIYNGTNWYETACTRSNPTTYSVKVTGVMTGVAGTFSNAKLGAQFDTGSTFSYEYATPTSWSNVTLTTADTLTIEWTLSI